MGKRWVSKGLNPSYELPKITATVPKTLHSHRRPSQRESGFLLYELTRRGAAESFHGDGASSHGSGYANPTQFAFINGFKLQLQPTREHASRTTGRGARRRLRTACVSPDRTL
ncbi:hypothetical protein ACVWZ4_003470 [Bradyrhizobium sp. USDA 4472]